MHTSSGPSIQPATAAVPPASSSSSGKDGGGGGGFLWWPIVAAVTGVIAAAFAAFFVAAALRRRRRNRVAPDTSIAARELPAGRPPRHAGAASGETETRGVAALGRATSGLSSGRWDIDLLASATSIRTIPVDRSGWDAADLPHAASRLAAPERLAWVAAVRPPEGELQNSTPDAQVKKKKKKKTKKPGVKATPILDFSPRVSFLGLQSPHLPNYVPTDGDSVAVEESSGDPAGPKQLTWAASHPHHQSATSLTPTPPRSRLPAAAAASPYAPPRPRLLKRAGGGAQQSEAEPTPDAAQENGVEITTSNSSTTRHLGGYNIGRRLGR